MDFTKCVNMARDLMDQHIPTAIITGNEYQQVRYPYSFPQYITSKQWLLGFYSFRKDYKVETIGFCKGLKLSGGGSRVYYNKEDQEAKYSEDDPNFKVYDNAHYYKLDSPTIALNWRFVATNKEHVVRSVILHEIAHAIHFIKYEINPRENHISGHTKEFWNNMNYLLKEAIKIGIYHRVDYKENPVDYCGMDINNTPLNME